MLDIKRLVPGHIQQFEPYTPSKPDAELMRLFGVNRLHRLNNNENPLGPPPAAAQAIATFSSSQASTYPSGDAYGLRQVLAAKFHKTPEQFLIGNGSCELITSVIHAFCTLGDNIVTADQTFAVYEWVAEFSGLCARLVPLHNFEFNPEGLLATCDRRTKIIFVCNPNNPTGTWWNTATLCAFLDKIHEEHIVVLDEAYCEYVDRPDYPNGISLLDTYPNILVFRTFSKMYALAGLRIGYLCGHATVVDMVRRAHVVYSVNSLAQTAAAAAIHYDQPFLEATRAMVCKGKEIVSALCREHALPFLCGEGNFMMIRVPMSDTLLYRKLMYHGVMIRTMTGFRFPGWIRVTMAQPEVMRDFCHALRAALP